MLTPFDVDRWQPTSPIPPDEVQLSKADLEIVSQKLSSQTQEIARYPYDPSTWLERSTTLTELFYPELALGDAYKAELLCRNHLVPGKRRGWKLGYRCGFRVLEDGGYEDPGHVVRAQKYLDVLHGRATERLAGCSPADGDDKSFSFRRRAYPWMLMKWLTRSDMVLDGINADFAKLSVTLPRAESWCVVRRHAFGEYTSPKDSSDVLGVFAARDIKQNQTILTDQPRAWGCNGPGNDKGVLQSKTVEGCQDLSHAYTLGPKSRKVDLRWIRDQYGQSAAAIILLCRLLIDCINRGPQHPLDESAVARMTATYPQDRLSTFSLQSDIVAPNEALQRLGIDIFTNADYDTWVLFTIAARVDTNACSDSIAEIIAPHYCLFNHSCEPNLKWSFVDNHRGVRVKAKRDIQQGEQLFIMYDEYSAAADVDRRRESVWRWLDAPCQCSRCVREEAEPRESAQTSWGVPDEPVMTEDREEVQW